MMTQIFITMLITLLIFFLAHAQETVSDYDGNIYHTVTIGTQTWLKENLKSLHYNDGTLIPAAASYNDNDSLANLYGRVYTWNAAMKDSTIQRTQGVCPCGWHVPSDSEWTTLESFLGGTAVAGGKMKDTVSGYWDVPNTGANNSSGFTMLPGGEYDGHDNPHVFQFLHQYAILWTSTQSDSTKAIERYLTNKSAACLPYKWFKVMKYSVRCLKNNFK